tara:strand:- start:583 stop:795 length:213 start_codon:yes stop_codon:yes gene_type:complete
VTISDDTWATEEFDVDQTEAMVVLADMAKKTSFKRVLLTKMATRPSKVSPTLAQRLLIKRLQLRLKKKRP